jgi:hypothetical protein
MFVIFVKFNFIYIKNPIFFNDLLSGVQPRKEVSHTIIHIASTFGLKERTRREVERLREDGLQPDVTCFNGLIFYAAQRGKRRKKTRR